MEQKIDKKIFVFMIIALESGANSHMVEQDTSHRHSMS